MERQTGRQRVKQRDKLAGRGLNREINKTGRQRVKQRDKQNRHADG